MGFERRSGHLPSTAGREPRTRPKRATASFEQRNSPVPTTTWYTWYMPKYIDQSVYGHAGGVHTARPQFQVRGNAVYATQFNHDMPGGKPLYTVKGGRWYTTSFHPDGKGVHAVFQTRGENIHTTTFHPQHNPTMHVMTFRPPPR